MRSDLRSYSAARKERVAELDRYLGRLVPADAGVCLIAVGSLGRGDLCPGSDLDLVLLHEGNAGIAEIADRIWYPVWDSGAKLDHSVRTVPEAVAVADEDLKAALGLIYARRIAGDVRLARDLREAVLNRWRADAQRRLAELRESRAEAPGELAYLLEPDIKDARGGLRDVHAMQAVAAAWVASAPGPRVREAYELLLDVRHALHLVTGRGTDRLVLQEQEAVAAALGVLDPDTLMRKVAEAGRAISHGLDASWRAVDRLSSDRSARSRRPLADGVVEQGGDVVLAKDADPAQDPVLVLRAAAAAAESGLHIAPATMNTLAGESAALPVPWPDAARDALISLLGAGRAAVPVWEELDQAGILVRLLPDWERVRYRPQRNPIHRFTVDRHLIETAVLAAAFTRDVSRPDLLLLGALLHDVGKGWPGDHSVVGEAIARDIGARIGLADGDVDTLGLMVRHHLLLPRTATRRDLDDPVTIETVAKAVQTRQSLELLAALAEADGRATGPAAWNAWKAGLVRDLVRRVRAVLDGAAGSAPPAAPMLNGAVPPRHDGASVRVKGTTGAAEVTVVAPDRAGLLHGAAGVLAAHRLVVRSATSAATGGGPLGEGGGKNTPTAVITFSVLPEYGAPPDPAVLESDLRLVLAGRLDISARLARRARAMRRPVVPVAPPRVTLVDDASDTATVIEVRAHDRPGLLWRIGRTLEECGLFIRAARVETLGAEAVDVFYVVDQAGAPLADPERRTQVETAVLNAAR